MPSFARSPRRGHALAEFALVAPVFLALGLGAIDWSYTMFAQQTLTSRAARAARWAAPRPFDESTVTGARNIVLFGAAECSDCQPFLGLAASNVAVEQVASDRTVVNGVSTTTTTLQVRISGYKMLHFAPFTQAQVAGRTIVAAHVWECADWTCTAE